MIDRERLSSPWLISAAAHALFIVASLFIVWTVFPSDAPPEEPVVITFDDPAPAEAPPARTGDASAAVAPALPSLSAPRVTPPPPTAAPPTESVPPPPRYETTFITAGASNAREVVYVVDASGSAISSFPYIAARLRDSLTALHPSQRFQILLIRGENYEHLRLAPASETPVLIDALPENINAALVWIDSVVPGGPSDLAAALTASMRVRADAVFVLARLSDADQAINDAALQRELDRLNPAASNGARRTTLHAMQMLDAAPSDLLRSLAETHDGAYDLLTLDDLRSPTPR